MWAKSTEGWLNRVSYEPGSIEDFYCDVWEDITEAYDDPRFAVSLLLRRVRRNVMARLDITNLMSGGWLEPDELPTLTAERRLRMRASSGGRVVVITEGTSDSQLVRLAFELVRPDIADYFAFLDFQTTNAPGGTDRVVSLTRGLAAAGVMNRVIALFDNDSAGRDGERLLRSSSLPEIFCVLRLPDVDSAESYPTVGPSGRLNENVNGRACSIEFMFGSEVMRSAEGGDLPPVRWKSYIPAVGDYQGELVDKAKVQQAILHVLRDGRPPPDMLKYAEALISRLIAGLPKALGPASSVEFGFATDPGPRACERAHGCGRSLVVGALQLPTARYDYRYLTHRLSAGRLRVCGGDPQPGDSQTDRLPHASPDVTRRVYAHVMRKVTAAQGEKATELLTQRRRLDVEDLDDEAARRACEMAA